MWGSSCNHSEARAAMNIEIRLHPKMADLVHSPEELTDEFVDDALVHVADIASKVESAFGHFVDNLPPSEA